MVKVLLQDMIKNLEFEKLPVTWNSFDLENFSKNKKLWDYQQSAVKNAIKVLWKYFEDFIDYQEDERLEVNQRRKQQFFKWYKDNGLDEDLDIKLDKKKGNGYHLLSEYYSEPEKDKGEDGKKVEKKEEGKEDKGKKDDKKISYEHFINRMSFWMATGSGKSLIIIKLIQILSQLIDRKEIPPCDILFLTHRDDLIEQFKKHVDEFNYANESKIILKELKEYPEVKRQRLLFGIPVFYYRSDNLSDEQKEKIIDFRNYDNDGRWYIFLDEAHKGDKEESKRQHIYSILSRNGFLFNFSATFTDPRDIITCAFEFNLSSFINSGYGKHICVLKQETRVFKDEEDYTREEKQKVVLKSLILLTYVKKFYEEIKNIQSDLYHKPLLLTLVNSVNTEDADLKLFFRELERIGKGEIEEEVYKKALDELWEELKQEPEFMFEKNRAKIDEKIFKSITFEDILKHAYNSNTAGEIEVLIRSSNRKELAFKLKTSDKPFALIKIGDISGWLKEELAGYEIQEGFEDENYFENLNREDSEINILMGSRGFYEGWDSNRPNIINFINIGVAEDARKFILQSVGRGIRIEPVKGKRKRLLEIYNAREIDKDFFDKIKDKVLPLEILFIIGTNRTALTTVIQELKKEKGEEEEHIFSLTENLEARKDRPLLIPVYKRAKYPLLVMKSQIKFGISKNDFEMLKKFVNFISDDRIFLMRYNTEPVKIRILKEKLDKGDIFNFNERDVKNIDLLVQRFFDYLSVIPEEFENLKELEDEIRHFKNIKVYLKDIRDLEEKIESVSQFKGDPDVRKEELKEKYKRNEIDLEQFVKGIEEIAKASKKETFTHNGKMLVIEYIANHYYIPVIYTKEEKIDYIKHIIKTESEVKFINDLEEYLKEPDNKFKEFDWWMFSKIDESLDKIYIPYYNPNINQFSSFYPDFIFWLQKGDNYFILFVDPKSTEFTSAYKKIDGYKMLFEEDNKTKIFNYNGLKVKVKLLLRSEDVSKVPNEYRRYWFDRVADMLNNCLSS